MSRTVVGRIFWKELRTLTGLWLSVAGVAVAAEIAVAFWFTYSRPWWVPEELPSAAVATLFVAYVTVILYAIATASAEFASEIEGPSGTPFRGAPVTRLEAFLGKWSYGLGSSAALLVALGVIALVVCACVGLSSHTVSPWQRVTYASVDREPLDVVANTWMGALLPIEFFALCALCSLLFSDVLVAAAFGSFVSVLASCGWWIGPVWVNGLFIAGVVAADFWLTGVWLRRGAVAAWESAEPRIDWPALSRFTRAWEPAAPWQRAFYALSWKEARQALPFAAVALLAILATTLHTALDPGILNPRPSTMFFRWIAHWTALLAIPLLMGLAACHVEQKGSSFLFCGERGVTPSAAWIVKHSRWLGLTFALCGLLLVLDHWAAAWAFDGFGRWTPHWNVPDSLLNGLGALLTPATYQGTSLSTPPVAEATILGTVALYIAAAYAIGQFFSFLAPKAVIALGTGLGGIVLVCAVWAVLFRFGVPIAWTVGVVPFALLAFTLSRSGRWQIGHVIWPQCVWLVFPLAAVLVGIVVYRMWEVPALATTVPPLRSQPGPPVKVHDALTAKLWSQAASACPWLEIPNNGTKQTSTDSTGPLKDAAHVDPAERKWVHDSKAAIALALEAATHGPEALSDNSESTIGNRAASGWSRLARLLAVSAREQESRGNLDEALLRYQAAIHLAVCLSHRYATWFEGREIACDTLVQMRGWAAHPGQTSKRLNKGMVAIVKLNDQTQRLSVSLQALWRDWLNSSDKLAASGPAALFSRAPWTTAPGGVANPLVPWEAVRDRRIVNALFATTVSRIDAVEADLGNRIFGGWVPVYGHDITGFEADCLRELRWLSTTPSMNRDQLLVAQDTLLSLVNWEAERRMDLIGVAIAFFHREHGRDPASFNELATTLRNEPSGPSIASGEHRVKRPIPSPASASSWLNACDPWSGREFFYMPGTANDVRRQGRRGTRGKAGEPSPSAETALLASEGFSQVRLRRPLMRSSIDHTKEGLLGPNRPLLTRGTVNGSAIFVFMND
jgi:hypothetical protein